MMKRYLPHPLLTLALLIVWVFLVNEISAGAVIFGLILAIIIPLITANFWPDRPRVRNAYAICEYGLIVMWDIIVANVIVAGLILFRKTESLDSKSVVVPLDLTSPEAITTLAGTITMTPGTVTIDLSADAKSLLVHCLHAPDPQSVVDDIKNRYERRLKEIFE
ncbi:MULTISPECIES: Na+/H+ antiporter subunit E [unclassified Thalassospira]|uniref:Na+/H+ antiporter subunit E n=1 Tax=unclassified Thalassospira TaxID=2648997 RepID=UPI0007A57B30|nr:MULTISPECIES: Na+/H+ antiporter subunit E [unclassified Thalassospira]KZC98991.1 cation:proton antiporter [Thalassospira sp. MCCC 1A02898]ONH88713.1 cation:proton antiporter [Thalassospira sp. MCCC 1A02803]